MSSSERTDFDRWMVAEYAAGGDFTALMLLVALGDGRVDMLACSHLHVVGDETRWPEMRRLVDGSGHGWNGLAIFPERAPAGGPLIEIVAAARLQARIDEVTVDRMVLNEAGFFDRRGRAIRIDPVE